MEQNEVPMDMSSRNMESRAPSYTIGNYELIKSEVNKFKQAMESAYDSLGFLNQELDINKNALSSENVDGRAGKSAVYFSNRIQGIGFELISQAVGSLHQLQAAVLHRYPNLKPRISQSISYGPIPPGIPGEANADHSEMVSVPSRNSEPVPECAESVPIENLSVVPNEHQVEPNPTIEISRSNRPSIIVSTSDANRRASQADQIPSEPQIIEDLNIEPSNAALVQNVSIDITVHHDNISQPHTPQPDQVVNEVALPAEAPTSESADEPMVINVPTSSSFPKTVISIIEHTSNPMTAVDSSVENETIELSLLTAPIEEQNQKEARKRGRPRKTKIVPKMNKTVDTGGDKYYESLSDEDFMPVSRNAAQNSDRNSASPSSPVPQDGSGNSQGGTNSTDLSIQPDYSVLEKCPKLYTSSLEINQLEPSILNLLKHNEKVVISESGEILSIQFTPTRASTSADATPVLIGITSTHSVPPAQDVNQNQEAQNIIQRNTGNHVEELSGVEYTEEEETSFALSWVAKSLQRYNNNLDRPTRAKPKQIKAGGSHKRNPVARTQAREKDLGVDDWIDATKDSIEDEDELNNNGDVEVPDEVPISLPMSSMSVTITSPETDSYSSDYSDLEEFESEKSLKKIRTTSPSQKRHHSQPAASKHRPKLITPRVVSSDSDTDDEARNKKKVLKRIKDAEVDCIRSSDNEIVSDDARQDVMNDRDSDDECVIVHSSIRQGSTAKFDGPDFLKHAIPRRINDTGVRMPGVPAGESAASVATKAMLAEKEKERERRNENQKRSKAASVSFIGEWFQSTVKGRREIRPIKMEMTLKTKQAEEVELDRLKAMEESQKLQEQLVIEKRPRGLVLEFDLQTKDPLISVEKSLSDKLHPHQESGVRFLYSSCFGSVATPTESGCVLAHLMGLGKTLTTLTLLHTVLSHTESLNVYTAVITCPLGVVQNWLTECERWLNDTEFKIPVYSVSSTKAGKDIKILEKWQQTGGILILHHEALLGVNFVEVEGVPLTISKSHRKDMNVVLTKSDILVCDEAHLLKNSSTRVYKAVKKFATKRKILLTGTPLQNNLTEYFKMINIIKPNLLGTANEFSNSFRIPIENGLHFDSKDSDVALMKRRTYVLNERLRGCVERKDYSVLAQFLKPKYEYALIINLSELQTNLYETYIKQFSMEKTGKDKKLWTHYHILQRIGSHPKLLYSTTKKTLEDRAKLQVLEGADSDVEGGEDSDDVDPIIDPTWFESVLPSSLRNKVSQEWGHSGKLTLLKDIVECCQERGDKLLIFSKYNYNLDLIEEFISQNCDGNWTLGESYFRLDGTIKKEKRNEFCENFNKSQRARVFLLNTKTGGLGINLHGANRVILFDVSFNPSDDCQSVFRVYRIGQTKECYVYRFVSANGMEEKTYIRSVMKLGLATRVVDERQVERHFGIAESSNMYQFTRSNGPQINQPPPYDDVLKKLLENRRQWISRYIEQDSLLMTGFEEDLNPTEKTFAISEVISKPANEKLAEKKQKRARKGAAKPSNPVLEIPLPLSGMNRNNFVDTLFRAIQKYNPELTPKQIYDLLTCVKEDYADLDDIRVSLNDLTISSVQREVLEVRFRELSAGFCLITGRAVEEVLARPKPSRVCNTASGTEPNSGPAGLDTPAVSSAEIPPRTGNSLADVYTFRSDSEEDM